MFYDLRLKNTLKLNNFTLDVQSHLITHTFFCVHRKEYDVTQTRDFTLPFHYQLRLQCENQFATLHYLLVGNA